ncbi:hypothetical protein QUA03_21870 [Microcoleus sp. S36b_A4]|uniref:hypothetical protein n=1 Tax=Microcoleus sp. S36b_A4 TaxID=3055420 RepID=UPI002FCF403A
MSNNPQNQDSLEEKLKAVTESNNSDKNYNAAKALVSSIPSIGALVAGFADSYIVPPATERLYLFLGVLVRELEELKSKIESVNFESPVFVTTFMRARQIAACTHKEQKLEALRNIVLNSSIPRSIEDDFLEMFLNWIDGFTALHISTLKYLHYLDSYAPEDVDTYFPMIEENRAIYKYLREYPGDCFQHEYLLIHRATILFSSSLAAKRCSRTRPTRIASIKLSKA